jgi:hypothetical protein
MRRQLDRDGEMVLARWLDHYQPDKETRLLIAEALDEYARDQHQLRFYYTDDESNRGVTIIEPQPGLTVHVQPRGPGQFTLHRIIHERDKSAD